MGQKQDYKAAHAGACSSAPAAEPEAGHSTPRMGANLKRNHIPNPNTNPSPNPNLWPSFKHWLQNLPTRAARVVMARNAHHPQQSENQKGISMSGAISDFYNPGFFEYSRPDPIYAGRDFFGMVRHKDLLEPRPLLMFPEIMSDDSDLCIGHPTRNLCVGFEADGTPIEFDFSKPTRCFGQQWLHADKPPLVWYATSTKSNLSALRKEFYSFGSGAAVSPRMRKIIEDYYGSTGEAPEIEFLPLQIFHRRKHDVLLGEWWYLNVFHWKEVFDLSRSKGVVYYRPPAEWADMDRAQFQARFAYDGKQIYEAEDLAPLPQAYEGGFYLAKLPYHRVLSNLFVGYELGRLMKEKCPAKKEIAFQRKRFGTDHMNGIVPPQTPEEKAEVDSWIVKD